MMNLSSLRQCVRDIGLNPPAVWDVWDFGKLGWEDNDVLW